MPIIDVIIPRANTAMVTKTGSDSGAFIGGPPFETINGAISAINAAGATGITIFVWPGIYEETIVMPTGNSLWGCSASTTIIRQLNVTADTTLVTMNDSTRIENVTLQLTSNVHVNLTGVAFPGTTTATGRIRTVLVSVDNSTASTTGTSNVYGIHSYGTGTVGPASDAVRATSVAVRSAGLGNKRALLVDTGVQVFNCRDTNFSVGSAGGAGSYIGCEVNQAGAQLNIRGASISGSTADISQTAGVLNIGYSNLQNSSANELGFSIANMSPTYIWGDPGGLPAGTRYYRPGSEAVSTTEIFILLNQKAVVKSLNVRAVTGPGLTNTVTWTIRKNGVDTPLTVTLTGSQITNSNNNVSVTFLAGDSISLKVVAPLITLIADTVLQVDVF